MVLTGEEVAKHNNGEDLWVIIHGHVRARHIQSFNCSTNSTKGIRCHRICTRSVLLPLLTSPNLTTLSDHPGGYNIILKYAGRDATDIYDPLHPKDTLDKYLDKKYHLGPVDMSTVAKEAEDDDPEEQARLERVERMPALDQCYNLMDFEAVARRVMKKTAWGYYSSEIGRAHV